MTAADCAGCVSPENPGELAMIRPALSLTRMSAPILLPASITMARSGPDQPLPASQAAPATTVIACVSSSRCLAARLETSAAENAAVSPASSATARRATLTKARASRSLIGPEPPDLAISGQAEPVAAPEHRLDDLRVALIFLDLAAQVLHVRVDRALVTLELVPTHPVNQLQAGIHPAGHGRDRDQDAPFGR